MEALKKLEKVQMMLSYMQELGLSSSELASDRFLANFLLFLVQPCNAVSMEKKIRLILEHLPKISARNLENAFSDEIEADHDDIHDPPESLSCENSSKMQLPTTMLNSSVGIEAMQHANSTVEDFCRSYFIFHGLDANSPHDIFKFLPILLFTESYIYQLDTMNERNLFSRKLLNNSCSSHLPENVLVEFSTSSCTVDHNSVSFNSFCPLVDILQSNGLLTERILSEFNFGIEYWSLERKLCGALLDKSVVSIEDVKRAIYLKSFDYRILNLLLYCMTGQQVNELHMTFLSVSELLGEISDDLYDYEEDVKKNSFNILRMFVNVYGASAAPSMLAELITEAEKKLKILAEGLDSMLCSNYYQRCKEVADEGRKILAHGFGTWNIPHLILDEETYRSNFCRFKPSTSFH